MDFQAILDAIKDYGAAIISTISVGGVAGIAAIIYKVKETIDLTKEKMNAVLAKKDEEIDVIKTQNTNLENRINALVQSNEELAEQVRKIKK